MRKENKFTIEDLKRDLDLDRRAFLRKYTKNLKCPGKMAIFIFCITNGQKQSISSKEIDNQWNKTKGILGKYNPAYLLRAREYGFMKEDRIKKNHYQLTNSWLEKFNLRYFK